MPEEIVKQKLGEGKSLDELEKELAESLRQAAEGDTDSNIKAIRERIQRKRESRGSGQ